MENNQTKLEATRIKKLKSQELSAAATGCAKTHLESACRLPQKQLRSLCRKQQRKFWYALCDQQEQQQILDILQTYQIEEQTKAMHTQKYK